MTPEQQLDAFGLFHKLDDDPEWAEHQPPKGERDLNLNDTFYWATGWSYRVNADDMKDIAQLFELYGQPGLWYWVMKKEELEKVEFVDVNRMVEFVRNEERIRKAVPSSSKRDYHKEQYTIGEQP